MKDVFLIGQNVKYYIQGSDIKGVCIFHLMNQRNKNRYKSNIVSKLKETILKIENKKLKLIKVKIII